jgi:hypothetical protein
MVILFSEEINLPGLQYFDVVMGFNLKFHGTGSKGSEGARVTGKEESRKAEEEPD